MEVNQDDDLYNNSYNELVKALSKLDLHLGTLKSSIACKRAECENLEKSLKSDKDILLKFEKEVTKGTSMATNMMGNIESFSTARLMAQRLEDSLLLQLQTTKDRCKNICSSQSQILSKYRDYLNNCEVIYTSLPWVEKRNKLKVELQCQQIKLSCLQKKFRDHQQKIRLFNEISEKRFQQAIISLAEAYQVRNGELQKRKDLCTREKRLTEDIRKLELEKKELFENVNKKAEVAVTQIRQRAQTYQSKSSIMPYFKKVASSSQKAPTPISQRLGLVEGLCLSSPMDVKKLSQPARSLSQSKTRPSLSFEPFKIPSPSKSPLQLSKPSPRKPCRRSTPSPKPEVEVFALNTGKTTPLKELRIQGDNMSKKVAKRKVRFTGEEENQPSKKVHEGEATIRKEVKEKEAQRDVKDTFRKPMPIQDVVQKKARESPRFNTREKVISPQVKLVSSPYSSPRGQTDKAAQLSQGAEEAQIPSPEMSTYYPSDLELSPEVMAYSGNPEEKEAEEEGASFSSPSFQLSPTGTINSKHEGEHFEEGGVKGLSELFGAQPTATKGDSAPIDMNFNSFLFSSSRGGDGANSASGFFQLFK